MKVFGKRLLRALLVLFILLNIIVICHAYKFTHFYDVGEVVVKDHSAKTGWDKTKEILFGFNAVKQVNDAPGIAVDTVYLETESGLRLQAWEIRTDSAKGTVALFHGHGGKKSSLLPEAAVFTSLGYNVVLLDFRAHGASEGNTCTIGYKEAEDVKLVYDHIAAGGEKTIVLYGISLGGATVAKAVHDYDLHPTKVILDMPFAELTGAVEARLKMMHLPGQPLATMLTFWGGVENGFWAFDHKPYVYVRALKCPVLLQRGRLDPRVTQEETELIYNNLAGQKTMVLYETAGHESLCKKETIKWTNAVTSFL